MHRGFWPDDERHDVMFIRCYGKGAACRVMDTGDLTCEIVSEVDLLGSGLEVENVEGAMPGLMCLISGVYGLVEYKGNRDWLIDGVAVHYGQSVGGGKLVLNWTLLPFYYLNIRGLDYVFRMSGHLFLSFVRLYDKGRLLVALDKKGSVVGWGCDGESSGDKGLMAKGIVLCL